MKNTQRSKNETQEFTHFDKSGNAVMVDTGGKAASARYARAGGSIKMHADTLKAILGGTAKKGDVLGVARIAGIMAAKKTASLIPLCHQLCFEHCTIDFETHEAPPSGQAKIEASAVISLTGKTGAEMEALTAVSIALLTIYDMCKALDRGMVISDIQLEEKSGGASGLWTRKQDGKAR